MPEGDRDPRDAEGAKEAQRTPGTVPVGDAAGPPPGARGPDVGTSAGILARRPAEADLGPLPRRLGRYEVLERIGSGGMGTVFRARQLPIDRIVALKVLSPDLAGDKRYIRRFVREARAAGALNHPNVVLVHDVGRVEGHPYICMEHVDGTTVERMLRERGRLAPDEAVSIAVDVARALEKAHASGIIHRDIKPDNILVDTRGVVKLADLGLARGPLPAGAESVTRDGIGMGTPCYMSVEQARDARRADARSDIYSLGATLYHMVTGQVPFDGDSAVDVLMRAAEDPLVSPAERVPGLPGSVVQAIERMMAKDASARYQTASALLADLEAVRNELAGLGPATLAGAWGAPRPPEGAGRLLMKVAAALGALVSVGLVALAVGGRGDGPPPAPVFETAEAAGPAPELDGIGARAPREADRPQHVDERRAPADPDGRAGGEPARVGRAPPRPRPGEAAPSEGPPAAPSSARAFREASRRARWYERAGRHGDAAKHLRRFAAGAAGAAGEGRKDRALAALEQLYARAEADSERTLARARELFAAGRRERGTALLEWALGVWGLPVLEARAEEAIDEGRRALAASAQRDAARARAEEAARTSLVMAEKKARLRSFAEAAKIIDDALAAAGPEGDAASELARRRRVFGALAAAHAAVRTRLAQADFGVPARDVFPSWAKGAVISGADADGIDIGLPGMGGQRARKRWKILSTEEYARLVEACARPKVREEMLGAGMAWLEAGKPDRAMRLWKTCAVRPEDASGVVGAKAGEPGAAADDALGRARRSDAAGRQRDALAALAPLVELELADPDKDEVLKLLIASLARDVDASRGLAVDSRAGPAEAEELRYDFSRRDWRGDWRTSA
ncbi:MAG: protein kinase domain-containing protein, partial [Planctomycetota bacterium]